MGKARASLVALAGTLVIGAIAFATGLVLFDEVVMPRFVHQGGDRAVPDLSNLNRQQAETATRARGPQALRHLRALRPGDSARVRDRAGPRPRAAS